LNDAEPTEFEELMFWGRVTTDSGHYYVAMGINYKGRYEFPEKKFYWCNKANGMVLTAFPAINEYWREKFDGLAKLPFKGDPNFVHEAAPKVDPELLAAYKAKKEAPQNPLDSTDEEDPD
jgi:radial spoke head protein 9